MTRQRGKSIIHTFSGVVVIDLLLTQMALTNINLALVSFVWFRTNTPLSQRQRQNHVCDDGHNVLFVMMCSSRLRDDSIMTKQFVSFPHRVPWPLRIWFIMTADKHVSHTGILSNFRTLAAHRDKQQTLWFGCFGKTLVSVQLQVTNYHESINRCMQVDK